MKEHGTLRFTFIFARPHRWNERLRQMWIAASHGFWWCSPSVRKPTILSSLAKKLLHLSARYSTQAFKVARGGKIQPWTFLSDWLSAGGTDDPGEAPMVYSGGSLGSEIWVAPTFDLNEAVSVGVDTLRAINFQGGEYAAPEPVFQISGGRVRALSSSISTTFFSCVQVKKAASPVIRLRTFMLKHLFDRLGLDSSANFLQANSAHWGAPADRSSERFSWIYQHTYIQLGNTWNNLEVIVCLIDVWVCAGKSW